MAKENKTAVTQLFDVIKGVAQYSENNPLLNQILMSEKRLLEIEKQQHEVSFKKGFELRSYIHDSVYGGVEFWDKEPQKFEDYFKETYGGDNDEPNS